MLNIRIDLRIQQIKIKYSSSLRIFVIYIYIYNKIITKRECNIITHAKQLTKAYDLIFGRNSDFLHSRKIIVLYYSNCNINIKLTQRIVNQIIIGVREKHYFLTLLNDIFTYFSIAKRTVFSLCEATMIPIFLGSSPLSLYCFILRIHSINVL